MELLKHSISDRMIYECYKEMYARAQPSVDFDEILKDNFNRAESDKIRYYERYYLSQSECNYILDKYVEAYNITPYWEDSVDVIIRDFTEGHSKDKYIPEHTDELGWHPGYRSYESVKPLKELIGEDATKVVLDILKNRKYFYRFDRKAGDFRATMCLGASPTSNPETVKKYWVSQGVDLDIDKREYDSNYFWEEEHGYLEEDDN